MKSRDPKLHNILTAALYCHDCYLYVYSQAHLVDKYAHTVSVCNLHVPRYQMSIVSEWK